MEGTRKFRVRSSHRLLPGFSSGQKDWKLHETQKRSGIVLSLTMLLLSARNAFRPLVVRFRQTVQSLTSAKRLNPLDTARRHSLDSVPGQE